MNDPTNTESAYDPQDSERLLVSRENADDVGGMTALYEPDALIDCCDGQLVRGKEGRSRPFQRTRCVGTKV
jgi:hypothetical protein